MPEATFNFPRGFLWGTATSAHQVEGNNTNNTWHAWEQQPGKILNNTKAGLACDWWGGRWKEDFDRAAESGQNTHRLSIEWSRVQPAPDRWDEGVLDYYREMMRGLDERDIKPLVTLHHFTDPLWLAEIGGWENEEVIPLFTAYVRKVVEVLGGFVDTWVTINEPNVYASLGYVHGIFPPGQKDINLAIQVMSNQIQTHAAAYHAIHESQSEAQVGLAINWRGFQPVNKWSLLDQLLTKTVTIIYNDFFPKMILRGKAKLLNKTINLPQVIGTQDFLGLNYYSSDLISFDPTAKEHLYLRQLAPPEAELSPSNFIVNQPRDFYHAIKWGLQFNVPIIITENGTEDPEDSFRRKYIVEHIMQMWRAVNINFPVRGYYHWSLVDNFEWERGWTQPFGLWALDKETQTRSKRRSADLYAAICQQNALSTQMVREYSPEVFSILFPG